MTLAQFALHLEAAQHLAQKQMKAEAVALRMAQADGKDWKRYMKSLDS